MKPPSGSPITGPSSAGMDRKDMAFSSRSCLGTVRSRMMQPTGHHGPGHTLHDARQDQLRQVLGQGTGDGTQGEQADGGHEHAPRAVSAAQPLTGTNTATDSR